ncbi:MAG: hypothetical protein M3P43_13980, partial [Actinomycetota bacterium]|nr:hypothetical protein [Actinomycetota bacterium]
QEQGARDEASAILGRSSRGTDVFGALALAEQFFAAYPGSNDRTLVILSDMVQSANGMHLGAVSDWSQGGINQLMTQAPKVDLTGVQVYMVGAGATTLAGTTPEQIDGIHRFWSAWFQDTNASVEFYGANLARFPIPVS